MSKFVKSVKEISFTFCGPRNYQPVGGMISEEILPALPNQQSNSEKQMKSPHCSISKLAITTHTLFSIPSVGTSCSVVIQVLFLKQRVLDSNPDVSGGLDGKSLTSLLTR